LIRSFCTIRSAAFPTAAVILLFIAVSPFAFAGSPASPAESPTPSPTPAGSTAAQASPSSTPKAKSSKPDEWTEASRIFEQLSPDQKTKFLDNLEQWKNMSPEERELFRDRELFRREKIAQEIQDSLTKTGLHLDSDQREVFALRYTQERRKIEESLHKEMDHERQIRVTDMLSRLKLEFSSTPTPEPTASP
jgi:DNA-directed RNA polymerase specialized sigma24 family protein